MSEYDGRPPSGWEDPYGQQGHGQQGHGQQDPYGQPGPGPYGDPGPYGAQGPYGQPPGGGYGYGPGYGPGYTPGYGPPGVPQAPTHNASTIAALVCNIVAVSFCCNLLAIPGIVTAGIAVGRTRTDPASARMLTFWSWALFGVSLVVWTVLIVVIGITSEDSGDPYEY